jgi:NAD(P)H-dependent FMN reductase
MANILVVVSSARKGRVADAILPFVIDDLKARDGIEVTIADLKELDLPFYDAPVSPADEGFKPNDERVIKWTGLVDGADGVIFLTPEYNRAINGIQKNAIDWIRKEWHNKPVSLIGYGWRGAASALDDASRVLVYLGVKLQPTIAQLFFTKQLAIDGTILDKEAITSAIKTTTDELLAAL